MPLQDLLDKAKTAQLYLELQSAKQCAQAWAQTVVNLSALLLADPNYLADASMDDKAQAALDSNKHAAYLESIVVAEPLKEDVVVAEDAQPEG